MIGLLTVAIILAIVPTQSDPQQKSKSNVPFNRLYSEHVGFVQYVLGKFRLSLQQTDELVQEVFLRFYQNAERVEPSKVRAYLATTSRNLAIDTIRREKKQKTHGMEDGEEHGTEESLWRNDPRRVLEAEIANDFLQEIQNEPGAETLLLFYRDGLSVKAIAEKLGESVGTITSRLSRSRHKIKERLQYRLDQLLTME